MQGRYLFEYAIIRIMPRVEREEFLNVGIILYCRDLKFLNTKHTIAKERINALCAEVDCTEVEEHLQAFEKICQRTKGRWNNCNIGSGFAFRWLTATRSTIIQTSKVHPGFCDDPGETLEKLFTQLVL